MKSNHDTLTELQKDLLCVVRPWHPAFPLGAPCPPYSKGQGGTTSGLLWHMESGNQTSVGTAPYCSGRGSPGSVLALPRAGEIQGKDPRAPAMALHQVRGRPAASPSMMEEFPEWFVPCASRSLPGFGPHTQGFRKLLRFLTQTRRGEEESLTPHRPKLGVTTYFLPFPAPLSLSQDPSFL